MDQFICAQILEICVQMQAALIILCRRPASQQPNQTDCTEQIAFFPHVFPPAPQRQIKVFDLEALLKPSIQPGCIIRVCACLFFLSVFLPAVDHTSAELAMHLLETPHAFLRHFEVVMLRFQGAVFKDNLQGFISAHPQLFLPAFPALTF